MSKIFDDIKNEYADFRNDTTKSHESKSEHIKRVIDEDRALLESSGVKEIFEEIKNSGLVKYNVKQVESVRKLKKFFKQNVSEKDFYTPAKIIDNGIYMSLRFDQRDKGYSEVRISAEKGELHIAHGYNRVDYTPIGEGYLKDAILDGLKNPLIILESYYSD